MKFKFNFYFDTRHKQLGVLKWLIYWSIFGMETLSCAPFTEIQLKGGAKPFKDFFICSREKLLYYRD